MALCPPAVCCSRIHSGSFLFRRPALQPPGRFGRSEVVLLLNLGRHPRRHWLWLFVWAVRPLPPSWFACLRLLLLPFFFFLPCAAGLYSLSFALGLFSRFWCADLGCLWLCRFLGVTVVTITLRSQFFLSHSFELCTWLVCLLCLLAGVAPFSLHLTLLVLLSSYLLPAIALTALG